MLRSITVSFAALALAGAVHAQLPVELELRGGAAIPTADLGDADLKTGGGFGFNVNFGFMPHVAAYAGWDWNRFKTEDPALNYDVEHNGYAFGLQFQHPLYRRTGYWVRAGGLYTHIELEDDDGELAGDTGHEFGWEAGGGLRVPVSERFALMPGVRYRALSADLTMGDTTTPVDLSYVTLEIGLQFSFGARPGSVALVR